MVRQSSPLSLKRRRRLKRPARIRKKWPINPKTRVDESGRIYDRQKAKKAIPEEYEGGFEDDEN